MNDALVIEGLAGKRALSGTITVSGAKNAALKTFAATLLFKDSVTIENVPDIEDIKRMADLLGDLGASLERKNHHTYIIKTPEKIRTELANSISKRMRSSILLIGPLLARFGSVSFPHPGGCVLGERPIDIFLNGFSQMGASVKKKGSTYSMKVSGRLKGAEIFMKLQSVTATETFMMAGVLAKGTTVLKNAATEPEIIELAAFLNVCGAKIEGAGTHTITIQGGNLLSSGGKVHRTMPDRIEAGSFLILAALVGKDITIKECEPKHIEALIVALRAAGVQMEIKGSSIRVHTLIKWKPFRGVNVKTHEYPGFPTDLQAPMTVFLTQTKGESLVFETIFEGRLNYTEAINSMGADITMMDPHRVLVHGPTPLRGKKLESPDIRAGLAFLIAASIAKGRSTIDNVYYIDRGYERIEERLSALGLNIKRIQK